MRRVTTKVIAIFVTSLIFFAVRANAEYVDPNIYVDTQTFNSNNVYLESADWWHTIPADFSPVSATIDLTLYVVNFSQRGTLDLFSSNTNTFDYGGIYSAPSKPGYVGDLWGLADYRQWDQVSFPLTVDQLGWLDDDGQIHIALIGTGYYLTDFPAQFYLESATLTATAVPIPAGFWLLGSGLIALVGIKGIKRKHLRSINH
jgi:hypothetical protein